MKKKVGLIIGVALCVFVLGLGIYHTSATETSPEMTEAEIEELVLEQYPGEIARIEKRKEKHNMVYEVKLDNDTKGYTLKVDGDTGAILKIEERDIARTNDPDQEKEGENEKRTADSGKTNDEERNSDMNDNDESKGEDKTGDNAEDKSQSEDQKNDPDKEEDKEEKNKQTEKDDDSGKETKTEKDKQTVIDITEAIAIGLKEYAGTIKEIELEEEDGQLIYEVEIVSGQDKAEIVINAYTGEIIVIGTEETDGIQGDVNSFINIEEALDIALNEFQGTVVEVELEEEDDSYIYEIEIKSGDTEKEFEIDVYSGEVVDID